jgi:hypothetical protein
MNSSERRFRLLTIVRQLKAAGERLLDATELCWDDDKKAEGRDRILRKLDECEQKLQKISLER